MYSTFRFQPSQLPLSGNSVLSGDIRRVFAELPEGEIYRVGNEDAFDISNPKTDISDQYNTIYNWSINSINDFGNAEGPIWSFVTTEPAPTRALSPI